MSWDLHPEEMIDKASSLPVTQTPEVGVFHNFMEGAAKVAMQGFAKTARAVDLLGAVGPIVEDWATDVQNRRALGSVLATMPKTVTAQDRYFKEHDALFQSAVDYWTPRPNEVGVAGEVAGSLLNMLPTIMASPALAVGATQLAQGQDLVREGVDPGKAQAVGAVQALGLGAGIWMPILGTNALQRIVIGGAGFNVVQGVATRAASKAILEGDKAAEQFRPLGGTELTLDILLGLAFGTMAHINPAQRAQGAKAWEDIGNFLKDSPPSDKAALATLREAQHINLDSLPGTPQTAADLDVHVQRMRAAIESLATDKPVDVENIVVEQTAPQIQTLEERLDAHAAERTQMAMERQTAWENGPEGMPMPRSTPLEDALAVASAAGVADFNTFLRHIKNAIDAGRVDVAQSLVERAERSARNSSTTPGVPEGHQKYEAIKADLERRKSIAIEEAAKLRSEFEAAKPAETVGDQGSQAVKESLTLDQRIDALAEERNQMADARQTEWENSPEGTKMPRSTPIEDAIAAASSPSISDFDSVLKHIKAAIEAGRIDVAQALVERMERAAQNAGLTPGVPEGSPKYEAIKTELERLKAEATAKAERLRAEFEAAKEASGIQSDQLPDAGNMVDVQTSNQPRYNPDLARIEQDTAIREAIQEHAKTVAAEEGIPQIPDRKTIAQTIEEQLVQAGRPAEEAKAGATLWQAFFDTTASRYGRTGQELFDRYMKGITGQAGEGPMLAQPDKLFQGAVPWYHSELERQIGTAKMGASNPKDWKNYIKGLSNKGVKADEVKWTGLEEWLDLQQGKVTKEQIQQYMKDGGVKVEETTLGEGSQEMAALRKEIGTLREDIIDKQHQFQDSGYLYREVTTEIFNELPPEWQAKYQELNDIRDRYNKLADQERDDSSPTKFATYQLPGGENYRELLLTLPENAGGERGPKGWGDTAGGTMDTANFRSSHFDQPNILSHIRFNERTDADGKKVLFIEEIQSDWAQKGKKEGFIDQKQADAARMKELVGQYDAIARRAQQELNAGDATARERASAEQDVLQKEMDALRSKTHTIPTAPFTGKTDAWVSLAMKRVIRYAAENGFDKVAWTRGEQQVERYSSALRKQVDVIEWKKTPDGVQLVGYKGERPKPYVKPDPITELPAGWNSIVDHNAPEGRRWGVIPEGQAHARFFNDQAYSNEATAIAEAIKTLNQRAEYKAQEATRDSSAKVVDTTEKESALSDSIGKAMADKIKNDPNQSGVIEGEDITVTDIGMSHFYGDSAGKKGDGSNAIITNVANDVLKKLGGGRVGEVAINQPGQGETKQAGGMRFSDKSKALKQPGFDITPSMREKAMETQALFQPERGALQFDQQGKMAIALLKSADPSTFLHESGHFFLEVTNDLASQPDAPAGMKQDMQTLYSWFGLKDADTWNNMTLDEKRPYHEQFARGFERYLRDGQAPTPVLKGLFQRFRDWLKAVYQSASQLNVEVSDQVRAVMDRMLAEPQRTEAPPEAARSAAPPPPRGGVGEPMGEASVPEGTVKPFQPKTSDDPQILEMLRDMATNEAGWAQVGGKWMGKAEKGSGVPNFTTWIPKAEWWNDRPDKKMNEAKFVEAVTKHMTDEKMTPAEKRAVQFLTDIANKRLEAQKLYEDAEWNRIAQEVATEGMEPTTQNVVDADAVSIAMQIDEARVERAAITAADDHDFMAEVREIIDGYKPATEPDTAATGSRAPAGAGAQPGTGKPGQGAETAGADRDAGNQGVIAQQAIRMVAENPDLPIATGVDAQGNTTYQKASEYLAEAKAMADLKRQDVGLFELAAQCLLGGGR